MESEKIITFLFGAGSAGTIIGTLMIWRVQRMWANIDEIPQLIRSINEMKKTVDTFSGELQSMNKRIHQNDKDLGKHEMRIDAAFRNLDLVIRKIEL